MQKNILIYLVAAPALYGSQHIEKASSVKTNAVESSESVYSLFKKISQLPYLAESYIGKKYLPHVTLLKFLKVEVGELSHDLADTKLHTYNNSSDTKNVGMASFNKEGTQFVTCAYNTTAPIIWDVETGKPLHTLQCSSTLELGENKLPGQMSLKVTAQFNRLGTQVLTICGNTVQIWQATTGQCLHNLHHETLISAVVYNHDETRLITQCKKNRNSSKNTIWTWNLDTGKCLHRLQQLNISSPQFINADTQIVTKCLNRVDIWNTETGEYLHSLPNIGMMIYSVLVNKSGTFIITCSVNNTAKIWDALTGKCLHTLPHKYNYSVDFDSTGIRVLTRPEYETIKIWNIKSGECEVQFDHHYHIDKAVFTSAGKKVLAISFRCIYIWHIETKECIQILRQSVAAEKVPIEVSFNDALTKIMTQEEVNKFIVHIWDIETGTCLYRLKSDYQYEELNTAVINSPGTKILTASTYGAKIWDLEFIEQFCRGLTFIEEFLLKEIAKFVYLRKLIELRKRKGEEIYSLDSNPIIVDENEIVLNFQDYGEIAEILRETYNRLPDHIRHKLSNYVRAKASSCTIS